MESSPSEWRVPAPIRALMWWPLTAFVLAMFNPEVAPVTIAVAGAVLAGLGGLAAALAGRSAAGSAEPAADRAASVAAEAGGQLTSRPA
jgi:succinate-acetate transporter protein